MPLDMGDVYEMEKWEQWGPTLDKSLVNRFTLVQSKYVVFAINVEIF